METQNSGGEVRREQFISGNSFLIVERIFVICRRDDWKWQTANKEASTRGPIKNKSHEETLLQCPDIELPLFLRQFPCYAHDIKYLFKAKHFLPDVQITYYSSYKVIFVSAEVRDDCPHRWSILRFAYYRNPCNKIIMQDERAGVCQ